MSSLKSRLMALEIIANPEKPWFTIEVNGEPTPEQWELMTEAHLDRREVYIFQTLGDTLGVWLVGADGVVWSDKL